MFLIRYLRLDSTPILICLALAFQFGELIRLVIMLEQFQFQIIILLEQFQI